MATRQEIDDRMAQYDPMHAQSTYTNPFNSRYDSRPFYVQADEAMGRNAPYGGPESLGADFQARFNPVSGGSVWERNMLQKQGLESRGAMDKLNASNSSNWATARSGMAMRGGTDAGARERMATSAAKTGIMGAQEQSRLDQMARLGIGAQAEDKRIDLEKYNNQGALDTNKWNIQNSINNGLGRNAYNLSRYNTLMQGYAADRSAKEAEKPGKK